MYSVYLQKNSCSCGCCCFTAIMCLLLYLDNVSVSNILTASQFRLNLILHVLACLMSYCLCFAMSHVSSIWMMSRVSSCVRLLWNVLARLVSWYLCLGKCLCVGKMTWLHPSLVNRCGVFTYLCFCPFWNWLGAPVKILNTAECKRLVTSTAEYACDNVHIGLLFCFTTQLIRQLQPDPQYLFDANFRGENQVVQHTGHATDHHSFFL